MRYFILLKLQNDSLKSFKKSYEESNKKNKLLSFEIDSLKGKLSSAQNFKIVDVKCTPNKSNMKYLNNSSVKKDNKDNDNDDSFLMRKRNMGNGIVITDEKENTVSCKKQKTDHKFVHNKTKNEVTYGKIKEFKL